MTILIQMSGTWPGVLETIQIHLICFGVRLKRSAQRNCVDLFSFREFTSSRFWVPEIVNMKIAHESVTYLGVWIDLNSDWYRKD